MQKIKNKKIVCNPAIKKDLNGRFIA